MGQFGGFGSLCEMSYKQKRLMMAQTVVECEGNLRLVAFHLGYHRSHVYRLVEELRMWPVINRVRRERLKKKVRKRAKE